jgi:CRP-like cAMP-binding protein
MLDEVFVKENIVHIGAFLYLAGFLCRDQLLLRAFVVIGDIVYILYFYFAPEEPLWGGIFWSIVFTLANVVMIARIVADRTPLRMSEEDRRLHSLLDALTPGEFRRLMRAGNWNRADGDVAITLEGQPLHQLAYVIDGRITVEKAGHSFAITPPTFIGEVAFLIDRPASATVTLSAGARYVTWDMKRLRHVLLRSPALRIGLGAAFNRDMAEKVARA